MAHVLKDSMNRFAIEITRSPKFVQCVIRDGNEVAFKRLPLTKTITDAYYHTDEGAYLFDQRWERLLYPDTVTGEERGHAALADLTKVIDSFLSGGLPVTDKAERMLKMLRLDPTAVEPLPSTDPEADPSQPDSETNEDNTMSKKTKVKKVKNGACAKVHEIASKMGRSADRKDVLAACIKAGINKGTAATQYQKWLHRNDKG